MVLVEAASADPGLLNSTRSSLATFLVYQFGTQSLTQIAFGDGTHGAVPPEASGPYALATLTDEETIARLASGIKRFKLPDEFNPIKIFETIAADPKTGHGEEALNSLAAMFENRRQLDRASAYWKQSRESYGDKNGGAKTRRLDQILGAWGQFLAMGTQPAGRAASVDFRFRNGRRVHFEARHVDVARVLKDVQDYFNSQPGQLDWQKAGINDIGSRLVAMNQEQYLGRQAAQWDLDLEPAPGHFDKRMTITTPLEKAGAYLLTARMEGGNTSRILVWLDDTVIVKKPLANATYYFVADARTGQPVPRADVELFGWRMVPVQRRNQVRFETKNLCSRPTIMASSSCRSPILRATRGISSGS